MYPVYIPSKGRYDNCLTAKYFNRTKTPFYLVVEPQEVAAYKRYESEWCTILPLDFENVGVEQLVAVRNWIWEHSLKNGDRRHWQIDDNIREIKRRYRGKRINCNSGVALSTCEEFVERYENVAIAGLNYEMFIPNGLKVPPFRVNAHVYSCTLILNSLPNRFRGPRNEDVDMCLQVLADGWCTIQFQAFLIHKVATMTMKGGNSGIYQDDGRLKMSRVLERRWPGVVSVQRRFNRPHHKVTKEWKHFDTKLIRRKDIDWESLKGNDERGMKLKQVREIKSKALRDLMGDKLAEDAE